MKWILDQEANQNTLMMYDPASGGAWYSLEGNYITLADIVKFGFNVASCHDLYKAYVSLPILICKRVHNICHSAHATKTANAKNLRHAEDGLCSLRRR